MATKSQIIYMKAVILTICNLSISIKFRCFFFLYIIFFILNKSQCICRMYSKIEAMHSEFHRLREAYVGIRLSVYISMFSASLKIPTHGNGFHFQTNFITFVQGWNYEFWCPWNMLRFTMVSIRFLLYIFMLKKTFVFKRWGF